MAGMNPNQIRVAGNGRILVAPLGTAAPADTASEWGTGWTDVGYTSSDGVKFGRKEKTSQVDTWQSVGPARFIYEDRDMTVKFSMLQFNPDTLPLYFGGGEVRETATGSGVYQYDVLSDPIPDERSLGLEFTDGEEVVYRFVLPRGQVTDTDEVEMNRKGSLKLGVTFTAMAVDAATPLATWLVKDPDFAGTAPAA
ncbi:phage tail protein [Streptomyces fenghuangensis]|uniref:phage tail tube protein n=1 Tax=Streptomyces sp. ICN903 TaxID=2964654 RepID=UPI001EDB357A|nr:phage tail protein [Streptomyces sp. ICN903]MCG3039650.1 phage tail protein [Streptomyces sp. ICN903]